MYSLVIWKFDAKYAPVLEVKHCGTEDEAVAEAKKITGPLRKDEAWVEIDALPDYVSGFNNITTLECIIVGVTQTAEKEAEKIAPKVDPSKLPAGFDKLSQDLQDVILSALNKEEEEE